MSVSEKVIAKSHVEPLEERNASRVGASAGDRVLKASVGVIEEEPVGEVDVLRDGTGAPSSTFWSFRDFRFHGRGIHTADFTQQQVNSFSQVAVSITELNSDGVPFIGDASLLVYSVSPQSGRVQVEVYVGWETDLNIRLNFIIVN